jgi:hypothetical protein
MSTGTNGGTNGGTVWGTPEVVFSAPAAAAVNFISNGVELAAVMTSVNLRFDPGVGPTSLTQVLAFHAPITVADGRQLIGYVQDLSFGITRSPGVRVLIVADLAGTVKTIECEFGIQGAPAQDDPLILARVFSPQGLESSGAGILGLVGPVADYAATISLTIQRRTLQENAVVAVEGLDVSAILTPPAASGS